MRTYLSSLRMEKGFSQRRVARESGVSYQHYSKLENGDRGGKVSLLIIGRIAKVLGVSLDELYLKESEYQDSLELSKESHGGR